jgi:Urea transporter
VLGRIAEPSMEARGVMPAARAPRRAADTWARLTQTNPAVASIDALLRGTGQVMFQNHPLTGLLFLVGIFVNSAKRADRPRGRDLGRQERDGR